MKRKKKWPRYSIKVFKEFKKVMEHCFRFGNYSAELNKNTMDNTAMKLKETLYLLDVTSSDFF